MKSFKQIVQSTRLIRSKKSDHGEYCMFVSGELLMIFPKGTWGMRCVRNYIAAMESIFTEGQFKQFGGIICLDRWNLGTPEVLELLSDYSQKSRRRGSIGQWLIAATPSDIALQVAGTRVVSDNELSHTADDIEPAIADLHNKGLQFDRDDIRTLYLNREQIWAISPTG